ncbi:hypothetical protein CBM2604_U10089 [Cupriavidus taiwanensis]|nr:hypothetical protein CBM2604_U10089 [Cupriavidus taiwanensis]
MAHVACTVSFLRITRIGACGGVPAIESADQCPTLGQLPRVDRALGLLVGMPWRSWPAQNP